MSSEGTHATVTSYGVETGTETTNRGSGVMELDDQASFNVSQSAYEIFEDEYNYHNITVHVNETTVYRGENFSAEIAALYPPRYQTHLYGSAFEEGEGSGIFTAEWETEEMHEMMVEAIHNVSIHESGHWAESLDEDEFYEESAFTYMIEREIEGRN